MSRIPRFSRALALAGLVGAPLVALGTTPASADHRATPTEGAPTYTITITNTTDGQWLTPPNVAAHPWHTDVFDRNAPASPGVQAVAENGGVPILAAELAAALDDAGLGTSGVAPADGPIAPGDAVTFEVTASGEQLSIVSMLICTNDGFAGLSGKSLPRQEGATSTYYLAGYDAGTELNTENRADIVPAPFCNGPGGTGEDQPEIDGQGFITIHPTLRGVGDLPDSFDWQGRVVKVTVTNNG